MQSEITSIPFEDPSLPFLERFLETVKLAFANPTRLFSNVPAEDIGPPVIYAVIIGTIGAVIGSMWQLMFGSLTSLVGGAGGGELALSWRITVLFMLFSPMLVLVALFIGAGLYHLMLLLLGGGSRGFAVTLKAMAYGSTPQLLGVLPFCGGLVGGLWSIVLVILGVIHGQRTEAWRAIVAYVLPLLFCCLVGWTMLLSFGILGALGSAR